MIKKIYMSVVIKKDLGGDCQSSCSLYQPSHSRIGCCQDWLFCLHLLSLKRVHRNSIFKINETW